MKEARSSVLMAVGLAGLMLAACSTIDSDEMPAHGAASGSAAASSRPAEVASPSAIRPASKSPRQAPTLNRLEGLTGSELRAALGEPTLLHREGPAQLWQYSSSGCVLSVFLVRNRGAFRVKYSELRIDNAYIVDPPTCVEWKRKGKPQALDRPPARPAKTPPSAGSLSGVA